MEKVDLTVSIESLRLDVLNYCLGLKGDTTVQKELENRLEELYAEYVSEEMRGYIDSKIKPAAAKPKAKRPAPKPQERPDKPAPGARPSNGETMKSGEVQSSSSEDSSSPS